MPDMNKVTKIALALAMPTSLVLVYWLYIRLSSSDEESYGRQRVVTSKHTTIEVAVPHKAVGAIIGRQGVNIKQIQATSGARLHFKEKAGEGDSDRTLLIQGTAESAQQAELMVHQTIANVPDILKEDIQVPFYTVGMIIGKGGSMIRDIQRGSGCRINIDQGDCGRHKGAKKIITLTGTREKIDIAVEMIEELVMEYEEKTEKHEEHRDSRESSHTTWQKGSLKASAVPTEGDLWDVPDPTGSLLPVKSKPLILGDGFFEVYVSAVEHPGHFWVQVIGKEALQLEQLQQEIGQWLRSDSVRKEAALLKPGVGEMVAAKFEEGDETFYRAKVLSIMDDGRIDLYFVDYGDNAFAEPGTVYKLRPDFLSLSFQAVECHLANVEPQGGEWTDEAITLFEDLAYCAQWKPLVARVVTYKKIQGKKEELRPSLHLFDTNGSQDLDINEELVRHSFAKYSKGQAEKDASELKSHNANTSSAS